MSEEFYELVEFPSYADEQWLNAQEHGGRRDPAAPPVRIVDFPSFIATQEDSAEPLLGTATDTILPLDGMLLMYGDGGAGKTTLTIDAVSHLGSGSEWLGIPVERPVKTLLIENEGPRGKFRQRLSEKHASWNGHVPFSPNVHVLEEPWTRFTLREQSHREALAASVSELEIDLVVMGPLVTLGMVGGGTPEEVSDFETLLRELRALITRPLAFWIVHHENKSGDVSGAWERVPDALCHVQSQGNGHTRLVWRKARWADGYHGTNVDLIWAEGRTFTVKGDEEIDYHAEILAAFTDSDEWRTVKETGKLIGRGETQTKAALADLVQRGEMVFKKGPKGHHSLAQCYRIQPALGDSAQVSAGTPLEGMEDELRHAPPPVRGGASDSAVLDEPSNCAGAVSAVEADDDPEPVLDDPLREEPPF